MGMKILSVDYDFFVNVSSNIATVYYPDGIDTRNKGVNEIIWSSHYSQLPFLYNLNINKKHIKDFKKILLNQNCNIPVKISESHVEIYDFILDQWNYEEDIELTNIDFHHDIFNTNNYLDCGNWIGNLKDEIELENYNFRLKWMTRPESLKTYGFNDLDKNKLKDKVNIYTNMDCISNETFDILFLCRSDPWTPPHLDKHFIDLINFIYKNFNFINITEDYLLQERKILNLPTYQDLLNTESVKNGKKYKKTKDSGTRQFYI
jgi:hypothetical protein